MSKKKKTVTAPRSFDPGKGRPKEYLAYLNWQEMQALQRLNGEGPYKGPRGIPSFVLGGFGSAGSGTYSSSGQQQKSSTTGARGPTGPRGEARTSPAGTSGGGAGSVSRTSGSQEGSRQGGGGSGVGTGTSPSGTRGAGAARTVDSSGRTTGPSSSLNAPARTQPSADTSARQVAATNDASKALQSTSALKSDFQSGGIKQISVGPMGTPVTVGGQVKGAVQRIQEQAYRPTVSPTDRLARTGPIGAPAYTPTMPDQKYQNRAPVQRYDAPIGPQQPSISQLEQEIRGIYEGTFAPYEPRFSTEQTLRAYQAERARKAGTAVQPGSEDIFSGANSPFADPGVPSYDPNTYNRVMGIPDSGVRRTVNPAIAASPSYLDAAGNYPTISTSRYAEANVGVPTMGNITGLRGVSYGSMVEPQAATSGGIKQISDRIPQDASVTASLTEPGFRSTTAFKSPYQEAQERILAVENFPEQDLTAQAYYSENYPRLGREGGGLPVRAADVTEDQYVAESVPTAPDTYAAEQFPKYVSPEVQQEMARIDKLNKIGVAVAKRAPVIGPIISAADTIRGALTGTKTTAADAALKRQYMQSSDEQKAALETKYPNLTKFANDSGIGSQLPESNYTSWAAERGLTGSGARERGGNDGTNVGIAALPANRPAVTPSPGGGTGTSTPSGDRPYIHYQWDLGINIPSPGDPNYNDYQRYLEQRAAARAAYG